MLPSQAFRGAALMTMAATFCGDVALFAQSPPDRAPKQTLQRFAVVELFTSQGCSSCPSADQNLQRVAGRTAKDGTAVYALSFHVDYWNNLGWKDPFSSAAATRRQRNYANVFKSKRIYTPQMVINGQTQFVGSDRKQTDAILDRELKVDRGDLLSVKARHTGEQVIVTWKTDEVSAADLINVALVQNEAQRSVKAGENEGRTLKLVNVVRDFQVARTFPMADVVLTIPGGFSPADYHVVAFLQTASNAKISGAARATIESE